MLEFEQIRHFQEYAEALGEAARTECVLLFRFREGLQVFAHSPSKTRLSKLLDFHKDENYIEGLMEDKSLLSSQAIFMDRIPGNSWEAQYSAALVVAVQDLPESAAPDGVLHASVGLFFREKSKKKALHFRSLLLKCVAQLSQELNSLLTNLDQSSLSFPTRMLKTSLKELSELKRALDYSMIVATTDERGVIEHVNGKFCEISGYMREELIGKTHRIVNSGLHPRGFWVQLWSRISKGSIWQGIIRNRKKNGDHYWVKTTIIPFRDSNGRIYQYMSIRVEITDLITTREQLMREKLELKATLENLAKTQQSLQRSARFADLGSMAAGIAHDFNNTLSVVLMGIELCLAQDPDAEISQILQRLRKTSSQASYHARKLLALGRTHKVSREVVYLKEFIEELLVLLRPQARSGSIDLKVEFEAVPEKVNMDPRGMSDVLRNLVLNSIQAMDSEGKCQFVIRIHVSMENSQLRFLVSDNGPGIPVKLRDRVFDPFFTTKNQGVHRGTGLGLAMVFAIVKDYGGEVEIESVCEDDANPLLRFHPFETGTSVLLRIPCEEVIEEEKTFEFQEDLASQFLAQELVLIDDEKYFLHYAKRALEAFGYEKVLIFNGGQEAIDELQSRHQNETELPALVLCDLQMPGVSGLEVFSFLKKIPSKKRPLFIPMTGKGTKDNLKSFEEAGLSLVLEKPFALSKLRKTILSAFSSRI